MSRLQWAVRLVLICLPHVVVVPANWVDPDTPADARSSQALTDGASLELVFSDEFAQDNRSMTDGYDPRWTALHKNDVTNNPLHYYSHDAIFTQNGSLHVTLDYAPKSFSTKKGEDVKYMRSGMLQSWNKFCFTGGIVEFSAKLPGDALTGGLWPALWMMGNLARATYVPSTEFMWPYSTNVCDSSSAATQEINACSSPQGRGAPEIDLVETMYERPWPNPVLSASLQVAPGIAKHRPIPGHKPNASQTWYEGIAYGNETRASINTYFYGVKVLRKPAEHSFQTDAISANMLLDDSHFSKQHLYRLEWEPPSEDGDDGYLRWYLDGELITGFGGESLRISGTEIPSEPMYLLMNIALSKDWGFPDAWFLNCESKCYDCANPDCRACALPEGFCENNLPAAMEIDYVRVYQRESHSLGCSPPSRPTKSFIETHRDRYMLPGQSRPLQPVVVGGGICHRHIECGHGKCTGFLRQRCHCTPGWTGPSCLAHDPIYSDDLLASTADMKTTREVSTNQTALLIVCAVCLILFVVQRQQCASSKAKYSQLP